MAGQNDLVYGTTAGIFAIPTSGASALLVTPGPGEVWSRIKYAAGSSIEIFGASATPTAGQGYMMSTTESIEFKGPAKYYLCATGATGTVFFIKGLSQGN